MRLDCLASVLVPSEPASRDVPTPLDLDCSSESDRGCGQNKAQFADAGTGATMRGGASSGEDWANTVRAQNKRTRSARAVPGKLRPRRENTGCQVALNERVTTDVLRSILAGCC